jgi:hypothetical protein
MIEPRITFKEYSLNYWGTFRFFDDRIELEWKSVFRSGRYSYPTSRLSEMIGEETTFAYGLGDTLKRFAIFLVTGLILHLGFDHPALHYVGFVLYGFAGMTSVLAIIQMKKDTWLYVKQHDGDVLFSVREKGLEGISREEFIREIKRYATEANKALQPTAPSGRV